MAAPVPAAAAQGVLARLRSSFGVAITLALELWRFENKCERRNSGWVAAKCRKNERTSDIRTSGVRQYRGKVCFSSKFCSICATQQAPSGLAASVYLAKSVMIGLPWLVEDSSVAPNVRSTKSA